MQRASSLGGRRKRGRKRLGNSSVEDSIDDTDKVEWRGERFRDLCCSQGRPDLLDRFRPEDLKRLLLMQDEDVLLQRMLRAEKTYQQLLSMHDAVDDEDVRAIFRSGAVCVRGVDTENHPIMWINDARIGNLSRKGDLYVLYNLWMSFLALRKRPWDVQKYTVVAYEGDRKALSTNLEAARKLAHMYALILHTSHVARFVIIAPRLATKLIVKAFRAVLKFALPTFEITDDGNVAFQVARKASDVPDYFVRGKGTPVVATKSTVGDFESHFLQRRFLNLNDIFNGSLECCGSSADSTGTVVGSPSSDEGSRDVLGERLG